MDRSRPPSPRPPSRGTAALAVALVVIAASILPQGVLAAIPPDVTVEVSWTRPGETGDFSPPAALRSGDTLHIHATIVGLVAPGCQMVFAGGGASHNYPSMWALAEGGTGCPDWTVVVPPTPPGADFRVEVAAFGQPAPGYEGVGRGVVDLAIEPGGSHQPFTSDYPVVSWAPEDLFPVDTPAFGVPITIPVPDTAESGCQFTLNGEWGTSISTTADLPGCDPWLVTLPELRPTGFTDPPYGGPWRPLLMVSADRIDPATDGRLNGTTYSLTFPVASGPAGAFSSDRPAAVLDATLNERFAYPGPFVVTPTLVGIDAGTCEYSAYGPGDSAPEPVGSAPVLDGSCASFELDVVELGVHQYWVRVVDDADLELTQAASEVVVVETMPEIEVVAPDSPAVGEPVDITASTDGGAPLTYEFTVAAQPDSADLAMASTDAVAAAMDGSAASASCSDATGALDVLKDDRDATTRCTFPTAATYRITATFTDAVGDRRSSSRLLTVGQGVVERWSGGDRYATAVAVSKRTFGSNVPVAFIATGAAFPDALAGAAAAGTLGGPVLLVPGTSLPSIVRTELTRLKPARIVVLGGSSVVSSGVATALKAYATSKVVERWSGGDRYATAVAVSKRTFGSNVPVAFIATGAAFPDALAGAAAAGTLGGPVLLVPGTSLPSIVRTELTRLKPARIVVLGGSSVVSSGVATALKAYATSKVVERWSGGDRYATAVAVSKRTFGSNVPVAFIATGAAFPDALAGAAAAGTLGGPVLLVPGTSLPSIVRTELTRLKPARIVVLGGSSVVSSGVATALKAYLR